MIVIKAVKVSKQNPHMGNSVFTQEDVNKVAAMTNLTEAKGYATAKVANSTANIGNKTKISKIIANSNTIAKLAMALQNCILAHPSEGLKVL